MEILRIHTVYTYLTYEILTVFWFMMQHYGLPKDMILEIFDVWSLLWCGHEHSYGNDALFAKRLIFYEGISLKSYSCIACHRIHYSLDHGWKGGWNTLDFPSIPTVAFETYNDWLNQNIDKYWLLANERLYYVSKYIAPQDAWILATQQPRATWFEAPLLPFYNYEKEHRVVKALKRRQHTMEKEYNKRRRI